VEADVAPERITPFSPETSGNVRDRASVEGSPSLHAVVCDFELPDEPADDRRFLLYPADNPLKRAGSPGVPPDDGRQR
jgi:hypothetical protein